MESFGQRRHDLRIGSKPAYVQADMSDKNSVIISPPIPSAVRDEMAAARAKNGQQKLSKGARIFVAGVISFGTEAQATIGKMPENEQERSAQDAVILRIAERIARESGHPLIGLVVHRDESSVHAHFTLRGFRSEGGKEIPWRFPPQFMSRLQDAAAEEVAHLGIERGKRKIDRIRDGEPKSKWVHRSVRALHDDLPKEIDALRTQIAALKEGIEKAETKREKNERLARKAEEKKKSAEIYINRESAARAKAAELERQAAELVNELDKKTKLLETIKTNVADAERRLSERNRALEAIGKEVKLPEVRKLTPQTGEFVVKSGFVRKETEERQFFPAEQVAEHQKIWLVRERMLREWAAQKAAEAAEKEERNRELEDDIGKRRRNLKLAVKDIARFPNSRDFRRVPLAEHVEKNPWVSLVAFQKQEIRYNVAVQILPGRVVIPSQTPATTAQIAAALYRVTKERFQEEGWEGILFTVPNEAMARMLLKMAREDKFEDKIEIHGPDGVVFFAPDDEPVPPRQMPQQPVRQHEPEAEAPRFRM